MGIHGALGKVSVLIGDSTHVLVNYSDHRPRLHPSVPSQGGSQSTGGTFPVYRIVKIPLDCCYPVARPLSSPCLTFGSFHGAIKDMVLSPFWQLSEVICVISMEPSKVQTTAGMMEQPTGAPVSSSSSSTGSQIYSHINGMYHNTSLSFSCVYLTPFNTP